LVELGKKARAARQAPQAAAYFNRALAFRPDDAELLRQVAGLAHTERVRRIATRVSLVTAVGLVACLGAYGIGRKLREPKLVVQPDPPFEPSVRPVRIDSHAVPTPSSSGSASPEEKKPIVRLPVSGVPPTGKTRKVTINVQGAKSSVVTIDGTAYADWFGRTFELSLGQHTLDVQPPNSSCCVYRGPTTFLVEPGEGPQQVTGFAPFRDATISLVGDGAQATCPTLFSGVLNAGASRKIKIPGPDPKVRGQCTITGPPEGSEPKVEAVELGPNDSRQLSWEP
jgi:hypothetical protein